MEEKPSCTLKMSSADSEKNIERPPAELTLRSGIALAGSALAFFCTVGFLNAQGVFQQYYVSVILRNHTNFQISWIGAFAFFCMCAFAPISGLTADKFGPAIPMTIGSLLEIFAVFMVSLCEEYYQFFLAQGMALGVGMSLVMIPASGVCPRYFKRNRAVAAGVTVAGSSLGGVLWPVMCDQLLHKDDISFAWTMRILGFILIPLLALTVCCTRPPIEPQQTPDESVEGGQHSQDKEVARKEARRAITKPPFLLLVAGLFVANLGFFGPFYFVPVYAVHIGISPSLAFYLVSILNAASMFGRIFPGFLADRYGRFNLLVCSMASAAIVAFCWTQASSTAGLIVWVLAYGFSSGAILSLQLACGTTLVDEHAAGAAVGTAMGGMSIAALFGPPISGELVKYGFLATAAWAGAALLAGSMLILSSKLWQDRSLFARV